MLAHCVEIVENEMTIADKIYLHQGPYWLSLVSAGTAARAMESGGQLHVSDMFLVLK